jgi:hypothetical protein
MLNHVPVAFSHLSEACAHHPAGDEFVDALAKKKCQIPKIELFKIDTAGFHNHSCVF